MSTVGVIGRFQPFHWGHFEYLWEAARLANNLIVGITNPDPSRHFTTANAPHRSFPDSNPLTFAQRSEIVGAVVAEYMPGMNWTARPADFGDLGNLRDVFSECDRIAVTIYDKWGDERVNVLRNANLNVAILWRREVKIVSASEVRKRITTGQEWAHLVPPVVAKYVEAGLRGNRIKLR